MLHWLMSGGAMPVLLPTVGGALFAADLLEQIDGLVLQGGSDMSPTHYGERALAARVGRAMPCATSTRWSWCGCVSSATCRCWGSAGGPRC